MDAAARSFGPADTRPLKLFFEDEARFGRMYDPIHCWAPAGWRPLVRLQRVREYTHVFSATCPSDGDTFSMILPYADTEMMTLFLQAFSEHYKDYLVVMVMDKAAWHRAKTLAMFDNVRILYQPPHSPELNPVEHLWEHIREKHLANLYWDSMDELEQALYDALVAIANDSATVQSILGFHWAVL